MFAMNFEDCCISARVFVGVRGLPAAAIEGWGLIFEIQAATRVQSA